MHIVRVGITLLILVLLGVALFLEYRHRSPGELSQVHAHLPGGCPTCHGDDQRSLARACNDCHEDIKKQLQTGGGFHGQLPRDQAAGCGHCHDEHRGRDYQQVGNHSFALAGFAGIDSYRHQGLDYHLVGRHTTLKCQSCHEHATDIVLQKGHKRFLGLRQECVACHEDPHAGKLPDCAACHGQERPFAQVALFQHDPRFPLVHSHQGLSCKQCHEPGSRFSIEAVGNQRPARVRGCADCHESRHSSAFLAATARATCAACHRVEHDSFASADEQRSHDLHGATGFELVVPHHEVACRECHQGPTHATRIHSPPRKQKDCRACHKDPHGGQFQQDCLACHRPHSFKDHLFDHQRHAQAGFVLVDAHEKLACEECHPVHQGVRKFRGVSRTCSGCHGDPHRGQFQEGAFKDHTCTDCHNQVHFRPSTFTVAMHKRTRFPLEGTHSTVACQKCHPVRRAVRQFRVSRTCSGCHADPHHGQFQHGAFKGQECTTCHNQVHFQPATFTLAMHGRTRFPLEGAHGAVACSRCHQKGTYRNTPTSCRSCHVDVHDRAFGKKACADCHDTESFRLPKGRKFDHGRWTGFELTGGHAKAACRSCHPPAATTHGGTRRMAKAGRRCADCHRDPHAGQFRGTDCSNCHSIRRGFDLTHFDHDRQSRFKLDETHKPLRCDKCHKRYRLAGGGTVVRYKPLGIKCNDCHGWERRR